MARCVWSADTACLGSVERRRWAGRASPIQEEGLTVKKEGLEEYLVEVGMDGIILYYYLLFDISSQYLQENYSTDYYFPLFDYSPSTTQLLPSPPFRLPFPVLSSRNSRFQNPPKHSVYVQTGTTTHLRAMLVRTNQRPSCASGGTNPKPGYACCSEDNMLYRLMQRLVLRRTALGYASTRSVRWVCAGECVGEKKAWHGDEV